LRLLADFNSMTKSKISLAVIFLIAVFVLLYVGRGWISKSTDFGQQVQPNTLYYNISHLYEDRNSEYKRTVTITNGKSEHALNVSIGITSSRDIIGHSHIQEDKDSNKEDDCE